MSNHPPYIGRFAPSPTGPLHFGSLVAALASFLDAKAHRGQWLVRMEDLDPAREPAGAAENILRTLETLGLHWDGPVLYQSQRLDAYSAALAALQQQQLLYQCQCTRVQTRALNGVYDNRCRTASVVKGSTATRVKVIDETIQFADRIQGTQRQNLIGECGDFVLLRKDGLFAYQLAVVVDDAFQGISDIVRGIDLMDSTPRQIHLQNILGFVQPRYAHIPVAVNELGQKLSKQHFAKALSKHDQALQLYNGLNFLGQTPEPALVRATPHEILDWAIAHWDIQAVPKLANIPAGDASLS